MYRNRKCISECVCQPTCQIWQGGPFFLYLANLSDALGPVFYSLAQDFCTCFFFDGEGDT